jgi:High potential iron-sulfur protein
MSTFTRRAFLKTASVISSIPLIVLNATYALAKISQSSVAYQDSPKDGKDCANCALFIEPNACKSVEGVIAPKAWCKIWVKKSGS